MDASAPSGVTPLWKYPPLPVDVDRDLFHLPHEQLHAYDVPSPNSRTLDDATNPVKRSHTSDFNRHVETYKSTLHSSSIPVPKSIPLPPSGKPRPSASSVPPSGVVQSQFTSGDGSSSVSGSEIIRQLTTGEEAVRYFATSNGTGPVKFLSLIRESTTGGKFRPFDLVVVDRREAESNPEHYTVSSKGVVMMCPEEPSEFFTLGEWMKFTTIYNILTSMKFFKYFLSSKMFDIWKSNVRYKLFADKRRRLSERLFLSKVSFCPTLLEAKKCCSEMRSITLQSFVPPSSHKYFDYSSFQETQSVIRQEASKVFDSIMEKLQQVMETVCSDVASRAKASDGSEGVNPYSSDGKSRSMLAMRLEQEEMARAHKQAVTEGEMLGNFIRLVDYLMVSELSRLAQRHLQELNETLTAGLKTALVETSISFRSDESGIFFSPGFEEYSSMFSQHLESTITMLNSVLRLIYTRPFNQFLTHLSGEGPKIGKVVHFWPEYDVLVRRIASRVTEDFQQCLEYVKIFETGRAVWEFQKQWNFADFSARSPSVDDICGLMDKLLDWERDIDRKLKVGQVVGMFHVESRKLKGGLTPITSSCIQQLKELLQAMAREERIELVEEYKRRVQLISVQPSTLKEFAVLVESLNRQKEENTSLLDRSRVVERIYFLLDQYKVEIVSQDQVNFDDMLHLRTLFTEEMQKCNVYVDSRLSEMKTQLDMNIARLKESGEQLKSTLVSGVYVSEVSEPELVLVELEGVEKRLAQLQETESTYNHYQKLFGVTSPDKKYLSDAKSLYDRTFGVWKSTETWSHRQEEWLDGEFTHVDVDALVKDVQQYYLDAHSYHKYLNNAISERLLDQVKEFKRVIPVVQDLGNPNMKERHWKQLFKSIGKAWSPGLKFSLQDLINESIFDHGSEVQEISGAASGEAQLEDSLEKIKQGWSLMSFTVLNHRDQKDLLILGSLDDIFTLLEDNQVTLQTMMGSRFIVGIKTMVETWEKKLNQLSETLDEWVTCQKNWMYLETIFSAEDIQKQLPSETSKFQVVDKHWRETMRKTRNYPLVLNSIEGKIGKGSDLSKMFRRCNEVQEEVLKSLEDYLETKRRAFPRFYFLSNDELLAILSQTRDPQAVQPHLQKCFDGIVHIDFGEGQESHDMLGMESVEGERVRFSSAVHADTNVEFWLRRMEEMMRVTLYDQTKASLSAYPPYDSALDRSGWLFAFPANCVLTVDQIVWCSNCTDAISRGGSSLRDFFEYSCAQIRELVSLVRGTPTKLQRMLMENLVIVDVHGRDCVSRLCESKVDSLNDFEWTKQLRYYWCESASSPVSPDGPSMDVSIRQTNACFKYGYEYLGCVPRLVITPLTDKCYMTLTGALHLRFGGAPEGPAGTGKTETVKDLAKSLARQCVVFNCSDGLDYKIMGRFFSGLSQAGAWSCFDEFNRIDIEVLSVIAQQILTIQQAIIRESREFDFEGRAIPLNMNFGVFITMNPGYAGRTELPDNLKALFRPCAMMVPDYRLIAEIILFSQGFTEATALANKMVQLYKLSSEQLSKQDHYDFGMRAVKSVLVAAGQLKRKESDTDENVLLIRAMRDSNVPKFLSQDLPLFMGIVKDLFPGVDVPYVDYGSLQTQIESELTKRGLEVVPDFVQKVTQIHETQLIRHGMMVVGEAGCGKTTATMILAEALTSLRKAGVDDKDGMFQICKRFTLNPKSITMAELYGESNLLTKEWKDGLVAQLVRQAIADTSPTRKWIMFDGPVDALWIENMNTVLDDNKMLCLANSERIKLSAAMHIMFEVEDLAVASPATVSRCGMVYMEQVQLGVQPLVQQWCGAHASEHPDAVERLRRLLAENLDAALSFVYGRCKQVIPAKRMNLTRACLNLLESLLRALPYGPSDVRFGRAVDLVHLFSFVWSFGGNLGDESRGSFNDFAQERFANLLSGVYNVFDYCIDFETTGLVPWDTVKNSFTYDPSVPYFNILVPTSDSTRGAHLLRTLSTNGFNVLFSGDTGVGKSVIVQSLLSDQSASDPERWCSVTVNFSAQTSSHNLQEVFEAKLESKRKTLLGPPGQRKMLMFIDDLNMPQLDRYFSQPPCELLRQVIDQGGLYDVKKLFFKKIEGVTFVCACAPPGGGRNKVTSRLLRHFNMIWLTQLSESSLKTIFKSIFGGFLGARMPELQEMSDPFVDSSIYIYQQVQREMLPTPSKSHYTFNLRDLSKVFQGMVLIAGVCKDGDALKRLWIHEESRVFRDRMTVEKDRALFDRMLSQRLKSKFETDWKPSTFSSILFGEYLDPDEKKYVEIEDVGGLGALMADYLEEYNINHSNQMHLVFFEDAIGHLSRVCRILSQRRGNALLVGVGGSGRKSLTRLAASIANYACFSVEITKSYGANEWHEDVKKALIVAGTKNQQCVFQFSDTQIVLESFLEDVNNLLNAGDIPNLYEADELEQILNDVRPLAKDAGLIETRDNLFSHYIHLIRENLHIVLSFSPVGDAFRSRCRQFPSLVNCCTIDWYDPWPEEALFSVSSRFLTQHDDLGISALVPQLCKACVHIHRSVEERTKAYLSELGRHNYTTPTSYLELILLYVDMLRSQRESVSQKIDRYRSGLKKLEETNSTVKSLQEELTRLKPVLQQAAEDTKKLLDTLVVDQRVADENRARVKKEEEETQIITMNVKKLKDECQLDLDEALPAYYSALKALDSLDKKHIQEMKSFTKPPQMVQTVMEAVLTLLDEKVDWGEAKRVLSDINFLERLKSYDKDNINPKIIQKLQKYVKIPEFQPEKIKTVSVAATSLSMWVLAMNVYDRVARNIAPKRAKLAEAEAEYSRAQTELAKKQRELQLEESKIKELKARYESSLEKQDSLETEKGVTEARLERAAKLTGGLGDERGRWSEAVHGLESDLTNLVGNVLLAAGLIAYSGPFTAEYRRAFCSDWSSKCYSLSIPVDRQFSLSRILADPVKVREWNLMGLPADEFSTENGLYSAMSRRWPLMIDPQGQANRWIKNTEKERNLQITKLSEPNFLRTLENAIRYGMPSLIENVEEELDPVLEPVLLKQVFKKGGQWLLHLGDADVPYSNEYKLYLTTKLSNPHFMPEVCIKVTVINFTVTMKGLEDQLLVDVVREERPDLEERKDALIVTISNDKKQLKSIEDKILHMLANSTGNILDDEELIANLGASKTTSLAIAERMAESERTTQEINETREQYRPVATRGSLLYFVLCDMARVDPMYQYSLQYFVKLYTRRIQLSEKASVLADRLQILIRDITYSIFLNVSRGLFEKDKLLFAFLISVRILLHSGQVSLEEWMHFLMGGSSVEVPSAASSEGGGDGGAPAPSAPCPSALPWMSARTYACLQSLSRLPAFASLLRDVESNPSAWEAYSRSPEPERASVPSLSTGALNHFREMMVLKAFHPEKVVFACGEFVGREMGDRFRKTPPLDLEEALLDSRNDTPLIFVLSAGADPVDYLLKLAESKGKRNSMRIISLGQGQGPIAEALMATGRSDGEWVCLQNCHLAVSWLPQLEKILEGVESSGAQVHEEYRLWLTSMPSPKFPVAILQSGIKLTQEPPQGLRANINRTFYDISSAEYESCRKSREYKKLLFGLAFYHAICLERRKFGAIGWNIPYGWMNSDLKTGMMQVKMYLEEQPTVPYETLNALVGDISYGGRVTDIWDKRTNLSILRRYFCPSVLDDEYRFSESGVYYAPAEGSLAELKAYIDELPLQDSPETFGLHPNADITFQEKESKSLLQSILSVQPRSAGGLASSGRSPDEEVQELAESIERDLPASLTRESAHAETFAPIEDGSVNSLGVFCEQEMVRFNRLSRVIRESLGSLKQAIRGLVVMSSALESIYNSILFKRVPQQWEAAGYPSLKPLGAWTRDLSERLRFVQRWISEGPPSCYWISGFFFPQGFVTGMLQVHSRRTHIAIDTLRIRTVVTSFGSPSDVPKAPESGVYINGLFMQGARWDRSSCRVSECESGVLFDPLPCVLLEPVEAADYRPVGCYECPVYKTSLRAGELSTTGHSTNFILPLNLSTDRSADHWIRRGVALLCQLDD